MTICALYRIQSWFLWQRVSSNILEPVSLIILRTIYLSHLNSFGPRSAVTVPFSLTLMGFLRNPIAVNRDVSLTSEGLPSRASTNRAATLTLFLAKYIPAAATVSPLTWNRKT